MMYRKLSIAILGTAAMLAVTFAAASAQAQVVVTISDAGYPYTMGQNVVYVDPYDYYYTTRGVTYHRVYLDGRFNDVVWSQRSLPVGYFLVSELLNIPQTYYDHPHSYYHPGWSSDRRHTYFTQDWSPKHSSNFRDNRSSQSSNWNDKSRSSNQLKTVAPKSSNWNNNSKSHSSNQVKKQVPQATTQRSYSGSQNSNQRSYSRSQSSNQHFNSGSQSANTQKKSDDHSNDHNDHK